MQRLFFLSFILVGLSLSAFSSSQFIVKYREGVQPSRKLGLYQSGPLFEGETLSEERRLYTVKFPLGLRPLAIEEQLQVLRSLPEVEYAQFDHVVTMRNGDEGELNLQSSGPPLEIPWNFQNWSEENRGGANVLPAWNVFGTGGRDVNGNEIVVAVIDSGFNLSHEDLVENFFTNIDEIPDNGLDDDDNGYIDDSAGWNAGLENSIITSGFHGTHVSGIIGAKGSNDIGVVGVNWDVKILPVQLSVKRGKTLTSTVMRAYFYIAKMKERWILSGGKEGANIVATNSSFGVDGADCVNGNYPIWDELYTKMGSLGILSAVATANRAYDVDVVGDVPSACASPYVVSVTNVDKGGLLYRRAAWGLYSVDLAAPGTRIYSTGKSGYGYSTGTSMSTPHVAGAIAYLHSVASKNFIKLHSVRPALSAEVMKDILLQSATPIRFLKNSVVTGGALNVYLAAKIISRY